MKAVILAGGLGTRISEKISIWPKFIRWHIIKTYSVHSIYDFVICYGYKDYVIKEYFANYFLHMSDVTFDMQNNKMEVQRQNAERWRVTLVDSVVNSFFLLELCSLLEKITCIKFSFKKLSVWKCDQRFFVADITKANKLMGWSPKVDTKDGIRKMLDWAEHS